MSTKLKKSLLLSFIFIVLCVLISITLNTMNLNYYNRDQIVDSDIYKTVVKINNKRWTKSDEAILVNINSTNDSVSCAPFAYAKDIPMFFTDGNEINPTIKNEFKKLGLKKIYIIGGKTMINKNIETSIKKMNISTERIFGKSFTQTSLILANKLCEIKDVKELVVINGEEEGFNGVAVASPASKKNMAIISVGKVGRIEVKKFIKEQDIQKTYFIGKEEQFPQKFIDTIPNSVRLYGKNQYDTNIKIIEEFYDLKNVGKIYMTKDGNHDPMEFMNTLSLSTLAAKENKPILFNSQNLGYKQKQFLKKTGIKNITEVGFELSKPKIISTETIRTLSCLCIIVIWILGIRRTI